MTAASVARLVNQVDEVEIISSHQSKKINKQHWLELTYQLEWILMKVIDDLTEGWNWYQNLKC